MADEKIPLDLRWASKKKAGEEPITERQIAFLIKLTGCKHHEVNHLGKLGASELIDEIIEERNGNRDDDREIDKVLSKSKSRGGCGLPSLILLGIICFFIWKFFIQADHDDPSYQKPAETAETEPILRAKPAKEPESTPARQPPSPDPDPVIDDEPSKSVTEELIDRTDGILLTLEGLEMPADLLVLTPVQLLNPAGQETTIPADAEIKVLTRSELGTLKLRAGRKTFVGNESRLKGKVRILDK